MEKDKYVRFHSYVEYKNKETKQNKNKHLDTENKLMPTRGEEREGKMGKGGQLYADRWKLDFWW